MRAGAQPDQASCYHSDLCHPQASYPELPITSDAPCSCVVSDCWWDWGVMVGWCSRCLFSQHLQKHITTTYTQPHTTTTTHTHHYQHTPIYTPPHPPQKVSFPRLTKVWYTDMWQHFLLEDLPSILDPLLLRHSLPGAPGPYEVQRYVLLLHAKGLVNWRFYLGGCVIDEGGGGERWGWLVFLFWECFSFWFSVFLISVQYA